MLGPVYQILSACRGMHWNLPVGIFLGYPAVYMAAMSLLSIHHVWNFRTDWNLVGLSGGATPENELSNWFKVNHSGQWVSGSQCHGWLVWWWSPLDIILPQYLKDIESSQRVTILHCPFQFGQWFSMVITVEQTRLFRSCWCRPPQCRWSTNTSVLLSSSSKCWRTWSIM